MRDLKKDEHLASRKGARPGIESVSGEGGEPAQLKSGIKHIPTACRDHSDAWIECTCGWGSFGSDGDDWLEHVAVAAQGQKDQAGTTANELVDSINWMGIHGSSLALRSVRLEVCEEALRALRVGGSPARSASPDLQPERCADCDRPKNDINFHFDAPGHNTEAGLHWYKKPQLDEDYAAGKPRPPVAHVLEPVPCCPVCKGTELTLAYDHKNGFNILCHANNKHYWDALELSDFAQFFVAAQELGPARSVEAQPSTEKPLEK